MFMTGALVRQTSAVAIAIFIVSVSAPTFGLSGSAMASDSKVSHSGRAGHALLGVASFYALRGKTSSGESFSQGAMTAAHRTLPFNTRVRVTCLSTGKSVVVRINDRGPFKPRRVIDVSHRAAQVLGFQGRGLTNVKLDVLP
jgi:rare lipoprotein A (peptidoglycan hydrolase)